MKPSKTITFFGSGPVAARSLELLAQNFEIEAVITKPQPPHHKERFPVLVAAEHLGLKVFTPSGKAELSKLFAGKPVTSQLGLVIDYGFIINQDVIDYFSFGIINSHFSLLPQWRGADPITFALLSGQKQTGVSLMLIVAKMDEGPILTLGVYDIKDDETNNSLTDHLILLSNSLLQTAVPKYLSGECKPRSQEAVAKMMNIPPLPTYSRKLTKADGVIDWHKPAVQLEREIRAFIDWPKSRTSLAGQEIIITEASVAPSQEPTAQPGDIEVVKDPGLIMVITGEGRLCITRLKPIGKAEMNTKAFLAGHHLNL